MATEVFRWSEQATAVDAGVARSLIPGLGADIKRIVIPAGTQAGRHSHAFEQFVIVESGRAKLTTASGECLLEPGVVIRFPPDTWHQAVFETDTVLLEVNLRS
jgi:quercetin dioxygenase-like cupin family protein